MKTLALLGLFCLSISNSLAEELRADFSQAIEARDTAIQVHKTIMQRLFGMNVTYSGALVPKKHRRLPFSMTSSETRKSDPFENVSVHPLTGRAEGIMLFSVNF